jgi:hypothetical protein
MHCRHYQEHRIKIRSDIPKSQSASEIAKAMAGSVAKPPKFNPRKDMPFAVD